MKELFFIFNSFSILFLKFITMFASSTPRLQDEKNVMDKVGTLSKTRKRKSIGETARKQKTGAGSNVNRTKTMVVYPKEIDWPILSEEENAKLLEEITSTLRILKNPIGKPSLKSIREVPKSGRRKFRKQFRLEEALRLEFKLANYSNIRSSLAIGVNSVSKKLESNQLAAVLIDPDVDPPFITKLLIPMAKVKRVPIIAIKGLQTTMNYVADFGCIALGLKICCEENTNYFNMLLKTLREYTIQSHSSNIDDDDVGPQALYSPAKIRKLTH